MLVCVIEIHSRDSIGVGRNGERENEERERREGRSEIDKRERERREMAPYD